MKKYKILMDKKNTIEWEGHILYRIKALRNFGDVKKGDIGGFVESEYNLSHEGNCWIYNNAKAMDNSRIYDNSKMYNNSKMYGHSEMHDNSEMYEDSVMYNDSRIYDNSAMYNNSKMRDNSVMYNNSKMCNNSEMHNNSMLCDNSRMHGNSKMYDYSRMYNNSVMYDYSRIYNNSEMHDYSRMYGDSELNNKAKLYGTLISKVDDFIEIQNPQGRLVTCVRKGDKVLYNVGCQNEIDEETFTWRIENKNDGLKANPHRKYYYKIIEMAKLYFGVK